jgi:neutral ceramidase
MFSRLMAIFLILSAARAADLPFVLRAGAARADITPEVAVLNWVTGKPYGVVLDPLNVHALVLDDGRTKAVILRWDLVDVSESARDAVRKVVAGALAMPGENILINASHNHSAPWSPVYGDNQRGAERDTWWALRYMPAQNEFPPFRRWMEKLLAASVDAAQRAAATARPVSLAIGRVAVGEYLYNRRPRAPAWGVVDAKSALTTSGGSPEWNPEVLQGGARFGPLDRTLAIVSLRDTEKNPVASLFHVACHSVSIYPSNPAISADWPGPAARKISAALGGESLFLQGCCGDINPWQRGEAAVATMAAGLATKAQLAVRYGVTLATAPLQVGQTFLDLPLTPEGKKRLRAENVRAEIQVIACGPLAIVGLPGETMTELGMAIREQSPFPQTLVLGYTNGNGVHYVGMPGEKVRGGYEVGVAGAGTDECGALLVKAAQQLLLDVFAKSGYRTKASVKP